MAGKLEDKMAALQRRIETLQAQKDRLIKELDDVEERFERQDRLYRRYFPVILDMVSEEDSSFGRACKALGTALRKKASEKKMAYIFEQMKTAMIKEDIGPVSLKKKKGLFSSLVKNSAANFMGDFQQGYHELVNRLRSTLDRKYATKLEHISARIMNVKDSVDMTEIRESVFSLIFSYISETNQDRQQVNEFIREIVSKILDIETQLSASYENTRSLVSSNQGFENVLNSEMKNLQQSSDTAVDLEALKQKITQGLTSIENALRKKKKVDEAVIKLTAKNHQAFKTGFAQLKKELEAANRHSEELEKKLNQDQLTGAYNRRAYDRKIADEMERFLRYGTPFSLLLIDADKFKRINDRYGHAIGDRCLQEIIKRTHPLLRKNDMLARYGGEEFAIIMPETEEEGARQAAEKIRQTIEKIEFLYKGEPVRVTVSIGVSCVKQGDTKHEQVFERVDMAVYKAKENGRNQVMVQ